MLPCVLSDRCGCAVVRVATIVWFQREADEECGAEDIKVYTSNVRNMYRAITTRKTGTAMKLVRTLLLRCLGPEERVIGLHMIGIACDEILQGFGVAMKMGATKAGFDSSVAVHPTAAEELIMM
eukprot:gene19903-16744_t